MYANYVLKPEYPCFFIITLQPRSFAKRCVYQRVFRKSNHLIYDSRRTSKTLQLTF